MDNAEHVDVGSPENVREFQRHFVDDTHAESRDRIQLGVRKSGIELDDAATT